MSEIKNTTGKDAEQESLADDKAAATKKPTPKKKTSTTAKKKTNTVKKKTDAKKESKPAGNIILLVPSYDPDEKLVKGINDLLKAGFSEIIVVDDGSQDECQKYFEQLSDKVHIVRHAVNQGKGRALKTGLNYAKLTYENLQGVIIADGDGQHAVSAILECKDAMIAHPDKLILGVRQFTKGHVPLANLTGNLLTIGIFWGLTQLKFSDTQCGLRGFPKCIIDDMIETKGERFEYENIMLLDVRRKAINFVEVKMEAIYIEDNQSSHFNKITDSISIYINIVKFALIPIIAGLLGFLFSYIHFMNLGLSASSTTPLQYASQVALTYATGTLFSWLLLSFTIKNGKVKDTLLIIAWSILSTAIFFGIYIWLHSFVGAWWLSAIIVAPIGYGIYLKAKYGKKPTRTKFSKDAPTEPTDKKKKTKKAKKHEVQDTVAEKVEETENIEIVETENDATDNEIGEVQEDKKTPTKTKSNKKIKAPKEKTEKEKKVKTKKKKPQPPRERRYYTQDK